jgi:peptidoglycan/LPS O-acetylase OafA/YrhL
MLAGFAAVCFVTIIAGAVYSMLSGRTAHINYNVGWNADSFLQGFPRVFYGVALGMVIAQFMNAIKAHPISLSIQKIKYKSLLFYLALVVMLALPLTVKYTYYLCGIGVAAPALVVIGALTICENRFLSSLSEFLGWMSYPIYCLHVPVYDGLKLLYDKYNITEFPRMLVAIIITTSLSVVVTKLYDEPVRSYLSGKLRRYVSHS